MFEVVSPQHSNEHEIYTSNYHLCIDTSLGYDAVNDMIQKAIKAGGFASAQGQ